MVVEPDGTVAVLGGPVGDLMLGVDPAAERAESVFPLLPGSTVLLFTDGLVERRDSTYDDGIARLTGQLPALASRPLDELCDVVLTAMLPTTPQDDVALVAVRLLTR
ncbi:SpoIIE family protein phosphatase [Blastococcus sp. PRF04-17]|uniref:SpoIIE family protein phosphatase n=1 Tax=Blastococcus sp. PRF04-17 TaxID=2933797 RepID=UPI0021138B58|nr:SpoIIE family protein phosphatase [Blastococcus sp. PRF04-17]